MPRTIDPILKTAADNGLAGDAFMIGYIYVGNSLVNTGEITKYKLTGTTLEYTMYTGGLINDDADRMSLSRGLTIAGIQYPVTTSKFFIRKKQILENGLTNFEGTIFPKTRIEIAADDTYENVITAFCTAVDFYGKTAVFNEPSADWLDYQFYPAGKYLLLNDAQNFLNVLAQKYFIFACDNGNEEILFYTPEDFNADGDFTITAEKYSLQLQMTRYKNFIWRDENASLYETGSPYEDKPIHNLGYLESTASPPSTGHYNANSCQEESVFIFPMNFERMDADWLKIIFPDMIQSFQCIFEEIFPYKDAPRWAQIARSLVPLQNTEGGALPSTIERVAAYTPLVTTYFDNNLDPSVNNLQALAEAVDELDLSGGTPDASNVTYTPADNTDWNSSADPGDADDALNQLAERVKDLESTSSPDIFCIIKPTATARNTTTTLADDPDLTISLVAGVYKFRIALYFNSLNTTMDGKAQFTISGSAPTLAIFASLTALNAVATGSVPSAMGSMTNLLTFGSVNNNFGFILEGVLEIDSTRTITLQWAQNTSNGSNLTLLQGSFLEFWKA